MMNADRKDDVKDFVSFEQMRRQEAPQNISHNIWYAISLLEGVNKSLEKLEAYSETESRKMIQVANNNVSDDASYNK